MDNTSKYRCALLCTALLQPPCMCVCMCVSCTYARILPCWLLYRYTHTHIQAQTLFVFSLSIIMPMTDHNHVPSRRHDGKANMYAILRQLEFIENANAVGVFNDTPEV